MQEPPPFSAAIGKRHGPFAYAVGREKVKEYAASIGETDSLHVDHEAARRAGFRDIVAPPMFCVVYSREALAAALLDPELELDRTRVVHGGQEFEWGALVQAGDEIATVVTVADGHRRAGMDFLVLESASTNQDGETVCTGTWTMIVRAGS